jgi:MFS family permease
MALAPSLTLFAGGAMVLGASISLYHPAGTALLTHATEATGSVFARHGMAGNAGIASASALVGGLGGFFGWRVALGSLAIPAVLIGIAALTLHPPSVEESRSKETQGDPRSLALLLLSAACMGVVYRGATTFLPKAFALAAGKEGASAATLGGAYTTAALVVGIIGMYLAGRGIDRGWSRPRMFLGAAVLQVPFLLLLGAVQTGPVGLLPIAMGLAFFHFSTQPIANHLVADYTPPRLRGMGYGLYFLMMFGAGSIGATYAGWVSETFGFRSIFPALSIVLIPVVVAALLMKDPAQSQKRM